jgi:hypothetical protein
LTQAEVNMIRTQLLLGALLLGGAAHATPAASAPVAATITRTVVQPRAVFDFVARGTDLERVCGGQRPIAVEIRRTAADVAAAVFSGLWYTPIHLRVTCAGAG